MSSEDELSNKSKNKISIQGFEVNELSASDLFKILSDLGRKPTFVKIYHDEYTIAIAEFEDDPYDVVEMLDNIEIDGTTLSLNYTDKEYINLIDESYECDTYIYEKNKGRSEYIENLFIREEIDEKEINELISVDSNSSKNYDKLLEGLVEMPESKNEKKNKVEFEEKKMKDKKESTDRFEKLEQKKKKKNLNTNDHKDKSLNLLIKDESEYDSNFEINYHDERFKKVFDSDEYRLDPTHPLFKKYKSNEKFMKMKLDEKK